jgi:NAD+ diphosphatase
MLVSDAAGGGPSLAFTGAAIDRAAEIRHDDAAIAALLSGASTMAVAAGGQGVLIESSAERLARVPWSSSGDEPLLLGIEQGRPLVAVDLDALGHPRRAELIDGGRLLGLREAGTMLPRAEGGLAAYLTAMLSWHRRHGFCAVCGSATRVAEGGLSRGCPNCGAAHFPRTDPVVIMTVEHEGRLLLGSRTGWPDDRYSILAGFVAPGETPEEAVVREVREESGIEAFAPAYVASQPWPFPASLMLGYSAQAAGGEPQPGGDGEMSNVRWFRVDEIRAAQRGEGTVQLPGAVSIARMLIDLWVDQQG